MFWFLVLSPGLWHVPTRLIWIFYGSVNFSVVFGCVPFSQHLLSSSYADTELLRFFHLGLKIAQRLAMRPWGPELPTPYCISLPFVTLAKTPQAFNQYLTVISPLVYITRVYSGTQCWLLAGPAWSPGQKFLYPVRDYRMPLITWIGWQIHPTDGFE